MNNKKKLEINDMMHIVIADKLSEQQTIDWDNILDNYDVSDEFIWTFREYFSCSKLLGFRRLNSKLLDMYIEEHESLQKFKYYNCIDSFIDSGNNQIDVQSVVILMDLDYWFINKYKEKILKNEFFWRYQKLTEEFMEQNIQYVNWAIISCSQKLSIQFMRKYKDRLHWFNIYRFQNLTEDFIEEINHYTFWDLITSHQTYLSEQFIEKHSSDLNFNWKNIAKYQKNVSKEFLEKHSIDIEISKKLIHGYLPIE